MTEQKKIKVTLVKSLIGTIESHRACARGLGSVSYTHLTLPTNREV